MATEEIAKICKLSLDAVKNVMQKKPEAVIGISKEGKNWKVLAEALERKSIPDSQDLLGRYELLFSEAGQLISFKQSSTRKRVQISEKED